MSKHFKVILPFVQHFNFLHLFAIFNLVAISSPTQPVNLGFLFQRRGLENCACRPTQDSVVLGGLPRAPPQAAQAHADPSTVILPSDSLMSGLQWGRPLPHRNPFFCRVQSGALCPCHPIFEGITDRLPQVPGHLARDGHSQGPGIA